MTDPTWRQYDEEYWARARTLERIPNLKNITKPQYSRAVKYVNRVHKRMEFQSDTWFRAVGIFQDAVAAAKEEYGTAEILDVALACLVVSHKMYEVETYGWECFLSKSQRGQKRRYASLEHRIFFHVLKCNITRPTILTFLPATIGHDDSALQCARDIWSDYDLVSTRLPSALAGMINYES